MKDNLLLATKVKKTLEYMDNIIKNYPKSEYVLRDRLEETMYNILENIYIANVSQDKKIYQEKIIADINMVEYYLKRSLDKKIISYKKYSVIGNFLIEINKMVYMWIKK